MRLILASRNEGKLKEVRGLLGASFEVLSLDEFGEVTLPREAGSSYEENALAKAEAAARSTGLPAVADDSGLEVPSLEWRPGIFSARFARAGATDVENNRKLLDELKGSSAPERRARFVCVAAAAFPAGGGMSFRGECWGRIADSPRGSSGFGYDPLFVSDDLGVTFAEADEEKQRVSHRARAFGLLASALRKAIVHHGRAEE